MIFRQPISAKAAEINLRKRLTAQHLGEETRFPQEYTRDEMERVLVQRAQKARDDLSRLEKKKILLSPFLEIGSEYGQASLVLVNDFEATGIASDIAAAPLRAIKTTARILGYEKIPQTLIFDAEAIPLPNSSLPFVFCSQTLHHFPHPATVTREVARVLEPGGVFFMADEPVSQRVNLSLWRRPTKLRWWEKILKVFLILPFLSRIGKTEVDHGVIEQSVTLNQWREALVHFEEVETLLTPVPFGPQGSLEKENILNLIFLFLLGGGIQATAKKAGVPMNEKQRVLPQMACVNCWVKSPRPKRPGLLSIDRLKPRTESPKDTPIHPRHKMAGLSGTVVKRNGMLNRPMLTDTPTHLLCPNCRTRYPKEGGIPIILPKILATKLYPGLEVS